MASESNAAQLLTQYLAIKYKWSESTTGIKISFQPLPLTAVRGAAFAIQRQFMEVPRWSVSETKLIPKP